jgi:hypothetical protein
MLWNTCLAQRGDIVAGIAQRSEHAAAGKLNRIIKGAMPAGVWHQSTLAGMHGIEPAHGESPDVDHGVINPCCGVLDYQSVSESRDCLSRSPAISLPDLSAVVVDYQILVDSHLAHEDQRRRRGHVPRESLFSAGNDGPEIKSKMDQSETEDQTCQAKSGDYGEVGIIASGPANEAKHNCGHGKILNAK